MLTRSNPEEQLKEYQIPSRNDWLSISNSSSRVDVIIALWEILMFASLVFVRKDKAEAEARARHRAAAREVRESLRVSTYGDLAGEQEDPTAASCAVCLSEVGRRDSVRELRNCGHVFHRGCLDRWLDHDERLSCPLCRAPLLSRRPSGTPPPPAEPSWAVERLLYLFGDDILVAPPPLP